MRSLLLYVGALSALALACSATFAEAFFSVIGYHREITADQQRYCPPRGPYADGGCDQCLPFNHDPLFSFLQIFCGPDRHCRLPGVDCPDCNGTCIAIWHRQNTRKFIVWGDSDPVRDVITGCNQWLYQSYCPGISGAYFAGESFSWIPPRQRSYQDLPLDTLYLKARLSNDGPWPFSVAEAWRNRIGLFTEMAEMSSLTSPDNRNHYARAANLAAWYYGAAFGGQDGWQVLMTSGFPTTLSDEEYSDLTDIHSATCPDFPFLDCTDPVEPSTWGAIKQRYHGR